MNELRWILLGLGLLLIGIIYLTSRHRPQSEDADDMLQEPRLEPMRSNSATAQEGETTFSEPPSMPALEDTVDSPAASNGETGGTDVGSSSITAEDATSNVNSDAEHQTAPAPVVMEKVIALHLVPRAGTLFGGVEFINALKAEGLKYDRFDIFHRFPATEDITENTPSLFSVANLIKPGTFNLRGLERQEFKGASMFLVLPGPEDAVGAFMDMVATGRRLAATLEGQLLDSDGTHLSRQRAGHLREEIVNYQHGLSVQGSAPA